MTSVALSRKEQHRMSNSKSKESLLHTRLLYLLFLPLPIIDSLNGVLNGGANEGFLSIGMAYRLCVIAYCFLVLVRGMIPKRFLAIAVAILALIIVPHAFDLTDGSFLSLSIKTLLPILCIEAFIKEADNDSQTTHDNLERLIRYWSILFPLAILIPFALGIGFQTYGEGSVGYKGFFYAQNDLCFILSVLFFFACKEALERPSAARTLQLILIGLCILLLGLKGGYILMLVSAAYWIMKSKMTMLRRLTITLAICVFAMLVAPFVSEIMASIVGRWAYFSNISNSFLGFFTSGRLERIPVALDYLSDTELNPAWFLFGSGMRYGKCLAPFGLIEMDPIDLFFQFGLCGSSLFVGYYLSFLFVKLPDDKRHYRMALIMALVLSIAAGHVLNSALSTMALSVLCGLAWSAPSKRCKSCGVVKNARE